MKAHRITIAEDDTNELFLLHRLIDQLYPGSSVASFSNAEDALAHIRNTGTDILITDHGMGKMSGVDLIRLLRDQKVEIPIIMVSSSPEVRQEAEQAGADAFVDKSSDTSRLRSCIQELLPQFQVTALDPSQSS